MIPLRNRPFTTVEQSHLLPCVQGDQSAYTLLFHRSRDAPPQTPPPPPASQNGPVFASTSVYIATGGAAGAGTGYIWVGEEAEGSLERSAVKVYMELINVCVRGWSVSTRRAFVFASCFWRVWEPKIPCRRPPPLSRY
jgi:hypothetical protein